MGAWHQLNLNLFKKALSVGSGKLTSELNGIVEEINKKEQSFEKLSDEEIKTNFQNLSRLIKTSSFEKKIFYPIIFKVGTGRKGKQGKRKNRTERVPETTGKHNKQNEKEGKENKEN